MPLKFRITMTIGLILIITISALSIMSYYNFDKSSTEEHRNRLQEESFLIANSINQRMNRNFDVLNTMSKELAIDSNGNIDEKKLTNSLKNISKSLDVINAYVAIENGETYSTSSNGLVSGFNAKEKQREWFLRAFSGESNIVTTPYISAEGDAVMSVAVPVKRNGRIVAVLCTNIKVNQITKFIESLASNNQVFVNRSDGYLLAAKYPNYIGKNLFDLRPSYNRYKELDHSQHSYSFDGNRYLVVSSRLNELGWNIWVWESWNNINSASESNLIESIIVSLFLTLFSISTVYFLVIKIVYKPIGGEPSEVEVLVKNVAEGNLATNNIYSKVSGKTGISKSAMIMVDSLKSIVKKINLTIQLLTDYTVKINQSAMKINNSTDSQMQQLEQTSTAMNEMTTTIEEVARNASDASSAAIKASSNADHGLIIMKEMNSSIENLSLEIQNVHSVISELESETKNVGQILDVISDIAEQTNLLALNAAIEAARAGEQGRGFAVVADEVRSLATRTQDSTNEIQEMIYSLQKKAQLSSQLMEKNNAGALAAIKIGEKTKTALLDIHESALYIQDMNSQIATAVEEQTFVAAEINKSIVNINELAKVSFDLSEQNINLVTDLSDASSELYKSIEVFKI